VRGEPLQGAATARRHAKNERAAAEPTARREYLAGRHSGGGGGCRRNDAQTGAGPERLIGAVRLATSDDDLGAPAVRREQSHAVRRPPAAEGCSGDRCGGPHEQRNPRSAKSTGRGRIRWQSASAFAAISTRCADATFPGTRARYGWRRHPNSMRDKGSPKMNRASQQQPKRPASSLRRPQGSFRRRDPRRRRMRPRP